MFLGIQLYFCVFPRLIIKPKRESILFQIERAQSGLLTDLLRTWNPAAQAKLIQSRASGLGFGPGVITAYLLYHGIFFLCVHVCLFRATPTAYGDS